jgi:hypothetical protein
MHGDWFGFGAEAVKGGEMLGSRERGLRRSDGSGKRGGEHRSKGNIVV